MCLISKEKTGQKSVSCVFVGYPNNSKGYKLFNLETRKMVLSRDVVVLESNFDHKLSDCRNEYREFLVDEKPLVRPMKREVLYFDDNIDSGEDVNPEADNDVNNVPPAVPSRPQRNREAPDHLRVIIGNWWDFVNVVKISVTNTIEPKNITEAFNPIWNGGGGGEKWSLLRVFA